MKNIIIKIISYYTCLYIRFFKRYMQIYKSILFLTKIAGSSENHIKIKNSSIKNSNISITGKYNIIDIKGQLWRSYIMITGNNNCIEISPNVILNCSKIIIRGDNCIVKIGQGSSFGSSYMICMGKQNSIDIGEHCMFGENIEIWNSDSHPIFDTEHQIINPSIPIKIGNHVWGGKGCKILKGVNIGDNAIIGMDTLVTKDIAPNTLNVGIPAHCIRKNVNWDRCFITI